MKTNLNELKTHIEFVLKVNQLIKFTFSSPVKTSNYDRISGQKTKSFINLSFFKSKQIIKHDQLNIEEFIQFLEDHFFGKFKQLHIHFNSLEWQVHEISKDLFFVKSKASVLPLMAKEINPKKSNGFLNPELHRNFLYEIGVLNNDGKIKGDKFDKFKQINRFIELFKDIEAYLPENPQIVDFGCGKSYLSFALYLYRVHIQNKVSIIGIDRKEDVISHCQNAAETLNFDQLKFCKSDIQKFQANLNVHMVISLHACDTATDDAIVFAIKQDVSVMMLIPCCQKELRKQIEQDQLHSMLKYGIIKEELTTLITNSLRALVLESYNYSVQILEFIDPEHTPKNVMIRAIKKKQIDTEFLKLKQNELSEFIRFWNIKPSILNKLKDIY